MNKHRTLTTLSLAATCLLAASMGSTASAQTYPAKPIRLMIGYVAGGSADFTARLVSQRFQAAMGQPVIVDSRPGAGSTLAIRLVAAAPADGYTLLLITEGGLGQSARGAKLPYDLERDLAPISTIAVGPQALIVHPAVPAKDVRELIALAQKMPGKLSYGSSGNGSAQHLAGELLNLMAHVRLTHVPFKGGSQAAVAVAGGEIEAAFTTIPSALPFINTGRVRLLAITLPRRVSFLPNVPTLAEAGVPGYEYTAWNGLMAPAGTAPEIVSRLQQETVKAAGTAESRELLNKNGLEPQASTSREFAAFVKAQLEKSRQLVKLAGIPAE